MLQELQAPSSPGVATAGARSSGASDRSWHVCCCRLELRRPWSPGSLRFNCFVRLDVHRSAILQPTVDLRGLAGDPASPTLPAPPLPSGHPSRRPLHVTEEDALAAMALVVLVVGTRPLLAPYQVRRYSQGNYCRPGSSFSLHRHWLEDFLIIFRNHEDLLHVLNAPPLPVANMVLRFRRWTHLSTADSDSMRTSACLVGCDSAYCSWGCLCTA